MRRFTAAVALMLALAGCEHTAPFAPRDTGSDQPFGAGSPRRVTFNLGDDRAPAWLPDESGFWYSFERADRADRDRCLALLPPDGGRIARTLCDRIPAADDSTDAWTEPAIDAAGRIAYVAMSSRIGDVAPLAGALVLATPPALTAERVVVTLPYLGSDQAFRQVAQLRWLGSDALVYVAQRVGYVAPCRGCALDTVRTGVELATLDLRATAPSPVVLPGTQNASSLGTGESPDVIYYTLGGDSRVFRRVLSSGADSVVHDFGAAGIARDVQVAGRRLVAVVGGNVQFAFDSVLGYMVQRDGGGTLHLLDLSSGVDSTLSAAAQPFRRPALSPSGTRLVAEAITGRSADLWEFDLP